MKRTKNRHRLGYVVLVALMAIAVGASALFAWRSHGSSDIGATQRIYIDGLPDKTVVLTIDDGPDPRFTPAVLDSLKKYRAHATFFVIGNNVVQHPDLVRREVAEGHEIANHTMTHIHLEDASRATTIRELSRAQSAIRAVTGLTPEWFRPPRGWVSKDSYQGIKEYGLQLAFWTFCLENSAAPTPQQMADRAFNKIKERNGSVLLMHDGVLDRSTSVTALALLLEKLEADGYDIVTLSEALSMDGAEISVVK